MRPASSLLQADVPALIATPWPASSGSGVHPTVPDRRAERHAQKEVGHAFASARRSPAARSRVSLRLNGRKLKFEPAARPFGFVEHAVAAAHHGAIAERPPRESQSRRDLSGVVLGDVQGQPGLTAGLNQIAEQAHSPTSASALCAADRSWSVSLRDDDRLRARRIERGRLIAIAGQPRRDS